MKMTTTTSLKAPNMNFDLAGFAAASNGVNYDLSTRTSAASLYNQPGGPGGYGQQQQQQQQQNFQQHQSQFDLVPSDAAATVVYGYDAAFTYFPDQSPNDLADIQLTPLDGALPSMDALYNPSPPNGIYPVYGMNGGGPMINGNGAVQQNGRKYQHSSPAGSSHTSTGSDDNEDFLQTPYGGMYHYGTASKRSPPQPPDYDSRLKPRGKVGKKRKPRRDPNEPQKPVSAYALFFRDTQAAIKGQNPNASFGEVSKIVASMWDSLDVDTKNLYKQKTEAAKKDYLKQLAAYRATLVSKGGGVHRNPFITADSHASFGAIFIGGGGSENHSKSPPNRNQSNGFSVTPPDSTTGSGLPPSVVEVANEIGEKSLASLIAEPPPQHILTATTTLTVPHTYIPHRPRADLEFGGDSVTHGISNGCANGIHGGMNSSSICLRTGCENAVVGSGSEWDSEYCSDECVVKHCRDVFTSWAQQPQVPPSGPTYTPV